MTVYWNLRDGNLVQQAAANLRDLIDLPCGSASSDLLSTPLAGAYGSGRPTLDGSRLIFNGVGKHRGDPMVLGGQRGYWYCDTRNMPYDSYVKASLILTQMCADDPDHLTVSCDGSRADWADGMMLAHRVVGSFVTERFVYSEDVLSEDEEADMVAGYFLP